MKFPRAALVSWVNSYRNPGALKFDRQLAKPVGETLSHGRISI